MNDYSHHHQNVPWYRNRGTLVLIGFIAVAGYFLLSEHQAHFIDFLPYLLLLACPLMHLFMHGGHGDHDRDNSQKG